MIVAVGTGTFLRMLYSLSLVSIRPTLFIYCYWDELNKKKPKNLFLNRGQNPTLPDSPQLLDPLTLSHSRDYAARIMKIGCHSPQ